MQKIAIIFTWPVVFLALVLYAFAFYVNAFWLFELIDALTTASPALSGPEASAVLTVMRYCIRLHPLSAIVGWLLWGFLSSMRRDKLSYEQF